MPRYIDIAVLSHVSRVRASLVRLRFTFPRTQIPSFAVRVTSPDDVTLSDVRARGVPREHPPDVTSRHAAKRRLPNRMSVTLFVSSTISNNQFSDASKSAQIPEPANNPTSPYNPQKIANLLITPSPIDRGTGYCFRSISLFVCMYLSFFVSLLQQDYEKTAGPICMKFSEKVRSDHGTTWLHFWSILRNRAMPRCATRGRCLLCFRTTACYSRPFRRMPVRKAVIFCACFSFFYLTNKRKNGRTLFSAKYAERRAWLGRSCP